ncbi:MAG: hypothetical protein KatS3mg099_208 [Candidatus Parcubacteria bacterium]|nr:MAG: hypothetical protein KatS3mg099_208 [Candidatus Parcubacteria bacterium]
MERPSQQPEPLPILLPAPILKERQPLEVSEGVVAPYGVYPNATKTEQALQTLQLLLQWACESVIPRKEIPPANRPVTRDASVYPLFEAGRAGDPNAPAYRYPLSEVVAFHLTYFCVQDPSGLLATRLRPLPQENSALERIRERLTLFPHPTPQQHKGPCTITPEHRVKTVTATPAVPLTLEAWKVRIDFSDGRSTRWGYIIVPHGQVKPLAPPPPPTSPPLPSAA